MIVRTLWGLALTILLNASAYADPMLTVSPAGLNGSGDREWLIQVSPDPSLFTNDPGFLGGSVAVEIGLEITGDDLLSAAKNTTDWPFDNVGHNPFTGTITEGVTIDMVTDTVFVALLSEVFVTGDPVDVVTLTTAGSGPTTVSWGGHTLLPGQPGEYTGSRIAQAGMNFDAYSGSVSSSLREDLNADGGVDAADAGILFGSWGSGDVLSDINGDGIVDAADAGRMFAEWTGDSLTVVPESVPLPLVSVAVLLFGTRRRNYD